MTSNINSPTVTQLAQTTGPISTSTTGQDQSTPATSNLQPQGSASVSSNAPDSNVQSQVNAPVNAVPANAQTNATDSTNVQPPVNTTDSTNVQPQVNATDSTHAPDNSDSNQSVNAVVDITSNNQTLTIDTTNVQTDPSHIKVDDNNPLSAIDAVDGTEQDKALTQGTDIKTDAIQEVPATKNLETTNKTQALRRGKKSSPVDVSKPNKTVTMDPNPTVLDTQALTQKPVVNGDETVELKSETDATSVVANSTTSSFITSKKIVVALLLMVTLGAGAALWYHQNKALITKTAGQESKTQASKAA